MFSNGPGDWGSILDRVIPKTQKMELDDSLLNTKHYKVWIKIKRSNLEKEVTPPLQLDVVALKKELWGHPRRRSTNLYIYIIYIYIYIYNGWLRCSCVKKKGGRGIACIKDCINVSIGQLEEPQWKVPKKTDFSHQKQFWQHEDQQNNIFKKW